MTPDSRTGRPRQGNGPMIGSTDNLIVARRNDIGGDPCRG